MNDPLLSLLPNVEYLDQLYSQFSRDPKQVDPSWNELFSDGLLAAARPSGDERPLGEELTAFEFAAKVTSLVRGYRVRGHLLADLDPLSSTRQVPHADLDPQSYGLSDADLLRPVPANILLAGTSGIRLSELVARLRSIYSGTLGVEFMHISRPERRRFLKDHLESDASRAVQDRSLAQFLLDRLIRATELERFIKVKYVGTKRFSLEGGESLIPLLDLALEIAGSQGVEEVVLGMAHRGRLNVLSNILRMDPATMFSEFEDFDPETTLGAGDLKYHMGYTTEYRSRKGDNIHLSLAYNPSHLEAVDPVVVGRVRAKQRRRGDSERQKVMGILVHGDAAFAGQGLLPETLQLSDLRGYKTGGTLHVIVNNQIGFTTSPTDSRSTPYPTDVAKMLETPIFHVNGDDPEAVARATRIAMDYRKTFATDVFIDLFCFRRHGHSEIDEPSFTQPLLYDRIRAHPAVYEIYGKKLVESKIITDTEISQRIAQVHKELEDGLTSARKRRRRPSIRTLRDYWLGYVGGPESAIPEVLTGVARGRLEAIAQRISALPEGFAAHPKIQKLLAERAQMGQGGKPVDFAMAEALAFGSLLWDGTVVRMSGQDTRRGTFSQRHAVVIDVKTGAEYVALANLRPGQAPFALYDSSLSEAAVLGFEFGFSLNYPDSLVLWEAQFGDFVNGAQVILDQFVSSSEDRWKLLSGIVLLLPHGYEGQGPEHSSARFERFLQLAAEDNVQVCNPSTPAQMFHLLRRQVLRKWRKPLVVLTPKSLLRLEAATSPLEALTTGRFARVLDDPEPPAAEDVDRVILCTGKIFYELMEERRTRKDSHTAIVRIEQLYPFWQDELNEVMKRYASAKQWRWVQEEPANMGAWQYLVLKLRSAAEGRSVVGVTRPESASPATGSMKAHIIEQRTLLEEAFA